MKACGIITEYNPFHYGHLHHIEETKRLTGCEVLINVMSGNFVQRGEPAIIDKWQRAHIAIQQGCDIVIELPYAYALQSADGFAFGAVRSLALAQVQDIVFGSECNNIETLAQLAKKPLQQSKTTSLASSQDLFSNDILGIAYLKHITHTNIQAHTIQRTNQYHDVSLTQKIASATAIRQAIAQGKDVSYFTPVATYLQHPHTLEAYYPYVQYLLLTTPPTHLSAFFLMDEGIEHLMIQQAKLCTTMKAFVDACISKRYTRAKIQRTIIHLLTQTRKIDIDTLPHLDHIRILATNATGRRYLRELKKQDINIVSRFNQLPCAYREMEMRVTSAYASISFPNLRLALLKQEVAPPQQVSV